MTYWPISSPSVFAATKNTNLERIPVSHDGTGQESQSEEDGAYKAGVTNEINDDILENGIERLKEEERGQRGQEEQKLSINDQLAEDDVHGNIVAIRVTRSGQLFATITRTTLTIWQTKVCSLFLYAQASLTS